MDEIIWLNDGTEILNTHCIEMDARLFVYINEETDMMRFAEMFNDPEKTERIRAKRYGQEAEYTGYTDLFSVSKEYGNVNLVLRKG